MSSWRSSETLVAVGFLGIGLYGAYVTMWNAKIARKLEEIEAATSSKTSIRSPRSTRNTTGSKYSGSLTSIASSTQQAEFSEYRSDTESATTEADEGIEQIRRTIKQTLTTFMSNPSLEASKLKICVDFSRSKLLNASKVSPAINIEVNNVSFAGN